jgi:hypothetical protein
MEPGQIAEHDQLYIRGDGRLVLNQSEQQRFASQGDAVAVHAAADQPRIIPQHHAATPAEFFAYAESYAQLTSRVLPLHCLFRGQTRDYFKSGGELSVLPAGFRSQGGPFSRGAVKWEWVDSQLMPWLAFLSDACGIDLGSCLKFVPIVGDLGVCRWLATRALQLTGSSLGIVALLQHYGFPTYFLDVTPNAAIAAWFALNKAVTATDGTVAFARLPGVPVARKIGRRSPEEIADIPCVQVYLQRSDDEQWPVLDLRKLPGLGEVALRPNRQEAFFLPFMAAKFDHNLNKFFDVECWRLPTAVIKLYFGANELELKHGELSADHLMPRNDPIYGALWSKHVPMLTNVGEPIGTPDGNEWAESVRKALPVPKDDEPRPGSIDAEAPNVGEAYDRVADVLHTYSVPYSGSTMAVGGVAFYTVPGTEVPAGVKAEIDAISAELNVPILVVPQQDDG